MSFKFIRILILIIFQLFVSKSYAQSYSLKGSVKDVNEKPLEFVVVLLKPIKKGVYTDMNGVFYFKNISKGKYNLQISCIGYKSINKKVTIDKEVINLDFILNEKLENLDKVVVDYNKDKAIKKQNTLNVEVLDKDYLSQNISGSLGKTIEKVAGLGNIAIGSGQSKLSIRGLSFNRILVADKGLKHEGQQWGADHGLEIDQYAVQDVQLVKGPSALAFGSDAIGGVINLKGKTIPKKNSFSGTVTNSFMTNNQNYNGSVFLSKRFDNFFFQGRVTKVMYGDTKVPTETVDVYNFKIPLYNNRLRNTAGNETNYHLNIGFQNEIFSSVCYASVFNAKSGFFANAHGLEPRRVNNELFDEKSNDILNPSQEVQHYKLINKTVIPFSKHNLNFNLGYQKNIRSERNIYVNHGFMPDEFPVSLDVSQDLERKFSKDYVALKISDKFKIKNNHLTIGYDLNYQCNKIDGWGFVIPDFEQITTGTYVVNQYRYSDKLRVNAGIRHDYSKIKIKQYEDWFVSENKENEKVFLTRVPDFEKNFNNISFSLGMNYFVDDFSFKLNLGNSFRIPIAKELAANGVNYHFFRYEKGNLNLDPERSYQLDLFSGIEKEKWGVQISPFLNYFSNYIYLNPTAKFDYFYGAGNQVFNYSQSKVFRYGGEVHSYIKLFEKLDLSCDLEYVKANQLSGSKKGFGLPFSPPLSVIFNTKYNFKSTKKMLDPHLGFDFRLTATQRDIVPPEEITKGYNLLNINFGSRFEISKYYVVLNFQIQNVLNRKYFNHTNYFRLINLPEQGVNFIIHTNFSF